MHQNKIYWKILDDQEFAEIRIVLDNVIKEHASLNLGVVKKQAGYIPQGDWDWDCMQVTNITIYVVIPKRNLLRSAVKELLMGKGV